MADLAHAYTDKQIEKLQHEIEIVYKQAEIDIRHKMKDFEKRYRAKESIHKKEVKQGKMTQEQFDNWKKGQVFQRQQWNAKRASIINTMQNANATAVKMINGQTTNVFAVNANYASYLIEHGAGVNFGFGIYDSAAVVNLIKNNPQALPKWKINQAKDYVWSQKKVNRAVTQGIIQGESIYQIADRLTNKLVSSNKDKMLTFARTAMTGAQNSGRLTSMKAAKDLGIDLEKEWMATLDSHTRDSHADIDGEKVPVDSKFSNGLQYPGEAGGAPAEVYNCRCTMVSNVKKYPAEYKRYDNIDGKPIENMTYKEWYEAKGLSKGKQVAIDYSKYGGKEVYDILSKYNSFDDFLIGTTSNTYNQFLKVVDAFDGDNEAIKNAIKEINTLEKTQPVKKTVPKLTTEEKAAKEAEKKYEKAKEELAKLEQKIKDTGADKTFENIWYNQTVTYADWESKKDSIQDKIDYYNSQIEKFQKNIDAGINDSAMLKKMQDKLDELKEFQKNGETYSKLFAERDALKAEVAALKPKPDPSKVFGADAYSQERKDAAVWAKSSKEADDAFRQATKDVWKNATQEEKLAAWDYTAGSGGFNRPLRGYENNWYNPKGIGNVPLDNEGKGKKIEELTNLLERSTLQQDTWLQRGVETIDGVANFVQIPKDILQNASQKELEDLLVGREVSDAAFMSCGSAKGTGFSGTILNIYCPEGTQALYVEPFSRYGDGGGKNWDGVSDQSYFGSELETLLQRNTYFEITKVEKDGYRMFIDLEVKDQRPHEYKYN